MKFLVNLFNHNPTGQRSLEDVVGIIGHQLRSLGHEIIWDSRNAVWLMPEVGVNVIVEGFTEASASQIIGARERGARFLMIATEEPTPKGFNHGTQPEMVARQTMFPDVGRACEGIIHLVPGDPVTTWYSQFAPAAHAELGFASSLVRRWPSPEPTFDFGFYGSVSPRRLKILKRLAKRMGTTKAVRLVGDFVPQIERDRAMREARVVVQLRKFDEMGLVSSSRCNTALCLGRPVVAEPHDLAGPWKSIVKFSETSESFFNDCILARANWRGMHAVQFERLKAALPPKACIGRALDEIGFFERVAAP